MKKTTIIIALLVITLTSFGQEFMGIKVDGSKATITSQFLGKGMTKLQSSTPTTLVFKGYANSVDVEVYVFFTPKTNLAWKFMVYLPKRSDWYELKGEYQRYAELFSSKYGEPTSSYSSFLSPYYEGDGYEISAVALNKCLYSSFWSKYSVEISEYKQVRLTYENSENALTNKAERNQINSATF